MFLCLLDEFTFQGCKDVNNDINEDSHTIVIISEIGWPSQIFSKLQILFFDPHQKNKWIKKYKSRVTSIAYCLSLV